MSTSRITDLANEAIEITSDIEDDEYIFLVRERIKRATEDHEKGISAKDASEILDIIHGLRRNLEIRLHETTNSIMKEEIGDKRSKIIEIENAIRRNYSAQKNQKKSENKLSTFDLEKALEEISLFQSNAESEIKGHKNAVSSFISETTEKLSTMSKEHHTKLEESLLNTEKALQNKLSEINKARESIEDILGAISIRSTSHGHQARADAEERSANQMRWAGIACMALSSAVMIWLIFEMAHSSTALSAHS